MVAMFFYYTFFASAVLYYGIGLNRMTISSGWQAGKVVLLLSEMFFSITATTVISYFFIDALLVPLGLTALSPFVALLFFTAINSFAEIIIRISAKKRAAEFSVSYLIVVLSLSESAGYADAFFIPVFCILSFAFVAAVLYSAMANKNRPEKFNDTSPKKARALFYLALIIIVSMGFDVAWICKI